MKNLREVKYHIKAFRINNGYVTSFFSEFLGTFVFISFGLAANACYVLGRGAYGDYLAMNLSWGMAIAMGIYVSLGASGGHLNPALSFTMMCLGRLTPLRFLIYILAQYLGAFTAAACIYGVYHEALDNFDGGVRTLVGPNQTMGMFVTAPQPFLTTTSCVADSVFGSMLLVLVVVAATDMKNVKLDSGNLPVSIFLLIAVLTSTLGYNTGNPVNPARDLGPRIFCSIAGWGVEIFSYRNYYFWIPLVMPHIGGLCGGLIYLILIERHLPDQRKPVDPLDKLKELETISISINPS